MSNVTALQTLPSEAPTRVSATALMMNPESMDRIMRMADMMAGGKSTIPAHLQKNPADCMAVVLQAMQWGMNPFAVAQKTHIVSGHLGYEAQLVNAVVQESGCITGRFHYEYKPGASVECRVGAVLRGESEITWGEWLNVSTVTTKNSPLWKTNPKQQLGYLQVKNWARAYAPGAILGVYTPDEFDAPQPRNMGPANEVQPDDAHDELLAKANAAAAAGVASYQAFWKETGGPNRKILAGEHERLKATAIEADKSRTVDQSTGEIRKTMADVMTMLCAANTEDALYVASDWINSIQDADEQAMLNGKFEERLIDIRGAA